MGRKLEKFDYKKKDSLRRKAALATAKEAIQDEVAKRLTVESGRAGMLGDFMDKIITGTPFKQIEQMWEAESEAYLRANKNNPKALTEINKIIKRYEDRLKAITEIAKKYVTTMARMHGNKLPPAALLAMRDGEAFRALTLSKILTSPQNSAILNAIEYVFITKTQTQKRYDDLCAYLEGVFKNTGTAQGRGEAQMAWFILNFLPEKGPRSKEDFIKYLNKKGLNGQELKALLREGCMNGAISPSLANNFTKNEIAFTEQEQNENSVAYKIQHDFLKKGRAYAKEAYGSYNPAARMLTLGNLLRWAATVTSATSMFGTLLASIFKGGGLKSPEKIVKAMTQKGMLMKGAMLGAALYWKKKRPGFWADAAERREQNKNKSAKNLQVVTESNRGLKSFLTDNKYEGSAVLDEYIREHGMRTKKGKRTVISNEPSYKKITLISFKKWLEKKAREKDINGKYSRLAAKITISDKGTCKINGFTADNDDLKRVSKAIFVWGIGGSGAGKTYNEALRRARGGAPKPPKNKKSKK